MLNQLVSREAEVDRWGMNLMPSAGRMPQRIVVLGGGTGLSVLLQGLRAECFPSGSEIPRNGMNREHLTAIVSVADDGGSSGSLRQKFSILAPGDIRNCLLALSDADPTLQALFNYRFDGKLGDHSLGNLMLTALTLLEKDFPRAIERASELLAVCGQVFPSTTDDVSLQAEFQDGSSTVGESNIAAVGRPIRRVSLTSTEARALPQALSAIAASDLVVIGPGSLYTSIIPTLLVKDIAQAISQAQVPVVLVMNLMTEPGETDGYSAKDVVKAIREHVPNLPIDTVLLNTGFIPERCPYFRAAEGAVPMSADADAIRALGYRTVQCNLLGDGPMIRHAPCKLARALLNITAC